MKKENKDCLRYQNPYLNKLTDEELKLYILENAIASFEIEGIKFDKEAWDWYIIKQKSRKNDKKVKD